MTRRDAIFHSRWFLPAFALALGTAAAACFAIGDRAVEGLLVLAVMGVFAAVVGLARGSETAAIMRRDGGDERFVTIDRTASLIAGMALLTIVLVLWLVEIARGHDGQPYGALAGASGAVYLVALAVLRRRR